MAEGACVAGGMHGGDMHGRGACMGRGHAWWGACVAGGHAWRGHAWQGGMHGEWACMVGGHVWQGGMHGGGHAWQGGHVWQGGVHGRGCACHACPPALRDTNKKSIFLLSE